MQLSPLQLESLKFLSVRIDPRQPPELRSPHREFAQYEFAHTKFTSTLEHTCGEESDDSPITNFIVTLAIDLPDEGDMPPPYVVSVKCVGYFGISKAAFPDQARRYDVGVVNGASLLYGAIRELVTNITSRSWYGPLLLPSLNFASNAPSKGGHEVVSTGTAANEVDPEKKTRVRKKTK